MKKNEIDIDIIMGVYNCEKYISDCIESIISQTFTSWKFIICDDGSTDNTYSIIKKYHQKYPKKIVLLKNDKNMGLNYTLNKCIENSTAPFIARMDGDDICDKDRLKKEINFLRNNKEYSFVSTNAILFDNEGQWGKIKFKIEPSKYDFIKISPFCHAAVLIKSEILKKVNGYTIDDRLLRVEDYHLWFKLYEIGHKGYNIQEYLYSIRDDRDAVNRRTWKNRKNEIYVRKIGFKMLNLPFYYNIYIIRPLVLGLVPKRIYEIIRRKKLKQ